MQSPRFLLSDELFLLMIDDHDGVVRAVNEPDVTMMGALLGDLLLARRLALMGRKIRVIDPTPVGDWQLDNLLGAMHHRGPESTTHWIFSLRTRTPVWYVGSRLAARGIVQRVERSHGRGVLGDYLFPIVDRDSKEEIVARLRRATLGGAPLDAGTGALLALARTCGCLPYIFTRDERRAAMRRAKEMTRDDALVKAVEKVMIWWVAPP